MKLKQKTETRVSENANRKNDVSSKNTSFSLFGATIITAFVALLVAHCPSSSTNTTTPTTGTFAFVCDNGTPTAGMTAPTATTNSCQSCNGGFELSGQVGSNCVASAPGTFAFVCSNGDPTDGMTAPTATTNSCQSCDSGYSLSAGIDSNCLVNAPTFAFVCANGDPSDGMTAPTATTNSCKGCDSGYSLSAGADSNCIANRTTSDLLITQFQVGSKDTTANPSTEFRQATSDSYGASAAGCRRASGNITSPCISYVVEIYNGTNAAVTLSDYALITSNNGNAWGIGNTSALACKNAGQTGVQVRFDGITESPVYDITNAHCRRLILADSLNSNTELASGSLYVVSRPEFNGNNIMPNQLWNGLTYSGNDGVALARLASSYSPASCPTTPETQMVSFTPSDGGSAETWCVIDKFGETYTNNLDYVEPTTSWRVSSSSPDNSTGNTFLRKRSVIAPTIDWDISRGCTANCNTVSPTIDATTQWIVEIGLGYTNVGIDTLPSN